MPGRSKKGENAPKPMSAVRAEAMTGKLSASEKREQSLMAGKAAPETANENMLQGVLDIMKNARQKIKNGIVSER